MRIAVKIHMYDFSSIPDPRGNKQALAVRGLLPAPLLVVASRWAGFAGVRQSLLRIFKVVTAFTAGHSITLALAALGLVRAPSRPIEVLIAVSILVSAAHAFRPLFPGREAAMAAFFGLIHGLAFAATLGELGLGRWQLVASILGFNLGIEAMQLIVVAVTMPSLVLLSRTRFYSVLRIGGALFAGFVSLGWIAERLLGLHSPVDVVVNGVAHYAVWTAVGLLLLSVLYWWKAQNLLRFHRFSSRTSGRSDSMLSCRLTRGVKFSCSSAVRGYCR